MASEAIPTSGAGEVARGPRDAAPPDTACLPTLSLPAQPLFRRAIGRDAEDDALLADEPFAQGLLVGWLAEVLGADGPRKWDKLVDVLHDLRGAINDQAAEALGIVKHELDARVALEVRVFGARLRRRDVQLAVLPNEPVGRHLRPTVLANRRDHDVPNLGKK